MTPHDLLESLDPFVGSDGETYIHVGMQDEDYIEQLPVDSPAAQWVLLEKLCHVLRRGFPTPAEAQIATKIAKGLAFLRPRREVLLTEHAMSLRPLVIAVLAIARDGGTRATLPVLLSRLNRIAVREALDLVNTPWPDSPDSLGKQLASNVEILKQMGVVIERNINDRPRTWTIPPLEDMQRVSGDGDVAAVSPCADVVSELSVTSAVQNVDIEPERDDPLTDSDLQNLTGELLR